MSTPFSVVVQLKGPNGPLGVLELATVKPGVVYESPSITLRARSTSAVPLPAGPGPGLKWCHDTPATIGSQRVRHKASERRSPFAELDVIVDRVLGWTGVYYSGIPVKCDRSLVLMMLHVAPSIREQLEQAIRELDALSVA
jgi:hypothetical protein